MSAAAAADDARGGAAAALRDAVADYLSRERREVEMVGQYLDAHAPFRKG